MTSLANILIGAPLQPCAAGDVLWKNADLETLDFVGVIPTAGLLDELLAFKSGGDAGTTLARLTPGHLQRLVTHSTANVRRGAVNNRLARSEDLAALASDPDAGVAGAANTELARRADLHGKAVNGDTKAVVEILTGTVPEMIEMLLVHDARIVTAGCQSVDTAVLFGRLSVLDPGLRDRIGASIVADEGVPVSTAVAAWACGDGDVAVAALDMLLASKAGLRRRLTPGAQHVLIEAGHLSAPAKPASPVKFTALDDMALILETPEIAAMYFSSNADVSGELHERIMQESPVQLLVNHLIGATPRKPRHGAVRELLVNATPERRISIAEALEKAEAEKIVERLAWGGELLLGFRRVGVLRLDIDSIGDLFAGIDAAVAGNELAWEYLMALSEEWESTIVDLVVSAANMEGINATAQSIVSAVSANR
jgi:hypothetical protein